VGKDLVFLCLFVAIFESKLWSSLEKSKTAQSYSSTIAQLKFGTIVDLMNTWDYIYIYIIYIILYLFLDLCDPFCSKDLGQRREVKNGPMIIVIYRTYRLDEYLTIIFSFFENLLLGLWNQINRSMPIFKPIV